MSSIVHTPLRDRELPLSSDVGDALMLLVGRNAAGLPVAFTKVHVIEALVEIVHTDDEGVIAPISTAVHKALFNTYMNRLTNSTVFQNGYKRYEMRSSHPVVPVTEFFFKQIYGDGEMVDVLEGMTELEIMQSLPKRTGVAIDGDGEAIVDEKGEKVVCGQIAGILIFPPNSISTILRTWLMRRVANANGAVAAAVAAVAHARPDTAAVAKLKEQSAELGPAMTRALPRPRK